MLAAVNPKNGTGVIGDGEYHHLRVVKNPRQFTKAEIPNITTSVLLHLPFALHGFTGTYSVGQCDITLRVTGHPKNVAGYNIGLPEVHDDVRYMKLTPDSRGKVNYTILVLTFKSFNRLSPLNESPEQHSNKLLAACTDTINHLLDWYCYVTGTYAIGRLSPNEFIKYEAWHSLSDSARYNHTFVHFPEARFSFRPPEEEGDLDLMTRAIALGKFDEEYSTAYRIYVEAKRAEAAKNDALAAILASSALEVALSHFIKSAIKNSPAGRNIKRISMNRYKSNERNVTLSLMLNLIFPLIISESETYPTTDVRNCDKLRTARNKAIHEPTKFEPSDVSAGLDSVDKLLQYFVNYIHDPGADDS